MKTCYITERGETLLHYVVKWEQNEPVRDFLLKCGQMGSEDFVILRASYPVEPLVRELWAPVSLLSVLDKDDGRICNMDMRCQLSECNASVSLDELVSEGLRRFGGDYLRFSFGRSGWENPGTGINYRLHFNIRSRYKGLPDGLKEYDVQIDNVLTHYGDLIPEKDIEAITAALDMLGVGCKFNGRKCMMDEKQALLLAPQKQADMYKFAVENGLETSLESTRPYFSSAAASHMAIGSVLGRLEFGKSGMLIDAGLSEKDMEEVISYFKNIDGSPSGKDWAVHFLSEERQK